MNNQKSISKLCDIHIHPINDTPSFHGDCIIHYLGSNYTH